MNGRLVDYHPWMWLTCRTCGNRFKVERAWWAELITAGGEISECSSCCPAAHETAPTTA